MSFLTSSMASAWSSVSSNSKPSSRRRVSSPSGAKRVTGHGLPGGVQGEQLAGHLGHRLAGPRLDGLPGGAAQAVERRRGAARADVARDLADLVVGHEQLVFLLEAQEEVVAGDAGHRARLDAREQGDAVVFVHDVVAGAQVEERGEASAAHEARPRRGRAQQAALAHHGELELGRDEALAQRRGDEVDAGRQARATAAAADGRAEPSSLSSPASSSVTCRLFRR